MFIYTCGHSSAMQHPADELTNEKAKRWSEINEWALEETW